MTEEQEKPEEPKAHASVMVQISQAELQQIALRMRDFENVCMALFPYVRHFGLCGAAPQAVSLVAQLADLLGLTDDGGVRRHIDIAREAAIEAASRQRAADIQWFAHHRYFGRKILRTDAEAMLQEMQEMPLVEGGADESDEGEDKHWSAGLD